MHALLMDTPLGPLLVAEENGALCRVEFADTFPLEATAGETPLLKKAKSQLNEYFAGQRRQFDLPLAMPGTAFEQAVWRALGNIPYGQTRSYAQIAAEAGNPRAARAVGMANHKNPISIIVPCHRVIGANGKMVGYGGGLDKKEKLLALEKQQG